MAKLLDFFILSFLFQQKERMAKRLNGSMAQRLNGAMAQRLNGAMAPGYYPYAITP